MGDRGRGCVVVVGGGAAGLMAAIFAAREGAAVRLVEGTADGGRKILISGGGRCNVLPTRLSPEQYVTASSPNTLKKMLRSWPLPEQRLFFETDLGVRLVEEAETGKLFPASNRAREVRDALVQHAVELGVGLTFGVRAREVLRADAPGWKVVLGSGETIAAGGVVLATGGLSVPQTGSDGLGLRIARELGHAIHATYPALTPLTADPHPHASLAGVSLSVRLTAPTPRGDFVTSGGFLFTHRGYSGPAVLDISHLAVQSRARGERQSVLVRWTDSGPDEWDALLRESGSRTVAVTLRHRLPDRLASLLLAEADIPESRTLPQLRRDERARLVQVLARYPLPWTADEGYRKAEVTGGGVSLAEVDPRTMESRLHPGLFLCGELLDAFGPIGGYNFVWAWATGRAAGLGAAARVRAGF